MIRNFINNFIYLDDQPMSEPERVFCKEWLNDRDAGVGQISTSLGLFFHGTMLVADQFLLNRDEFRSFFFRLHVGCILMAALYWLIRLKSKSPLRLLVAVGQFSTFLGYAYVLNWVSAVDPSMDVAHLKAWTAYVVLGIFLTLLCPFHSFLALLYSGVLVTAAWVVWAKIPQASGMIGISFIAFFGAQLFQRFSVVRALQDARQEFENRKKVAESQQDAYNQRLIVARNIQDSFAAPKEFISSGIKIQFFQKRSEAVGGDWMAIRSDKIGKISILVADAAGKGVQAALVIHAVQALWADALSDSNFDPNKWLCKVNNTLCRMGHGSSHSATIGVLTLDETHIEYWSAGHLPAIVVDQSQEDDVHPLPARGPMLGLQEVDEFVSFRRKIGDWSFHILLASDGVFEKGATESPRSVRQLLNATKTDPNFLANLTFQNDDDRSLILVHVDPSKIRPGLI